MCASLRLGVLRCVHFLVEHAFLGVAFFSFCTLPLSVTERLHARVDTARQAAGALGGTFVSDPDTHRLVWAFVPQTMVDQRGSRWEVMNTTHDPSRDYRYEVPCRPQLGVPLKYACRHCEDTLACVRLGFPGETPLLPQQASYLELNDTASETTRERCRGPIEMSWNCAQGSGEHSQPVANTFVMSLVYLNLTVSAVGGIIMLRGFCINLRVPFGSFRYYQQVVQYRRSWLVQGFLLFFSAAAAVYFCVHMVLALFEEHFAWNIELFLLYSSCVTGLVKGFDFDEDFYLRSEERGKNGEGCCGRRRCLSYTSNAEFTENVLLFDSWTDLIAPSAKTVSIVESAAACYWSTGNFAPLLGIMRGTRSGQLKRDRAEQLGAALCGKGSAIQRRMRSEAHAVQKDLHRKDSGCCCCTRMDDASEEHAIAMVENPSKNPAT